MKQVQVQVWTSPGGPGPGPEKMSWTSDSLDTKSRLFFFFPLRGGMDSTLEIKPGKICELFGFIER